MSPIFPILAALATQAADPAQDPVVVIAPEKERATAKVIGGITSLTDAGGGVRQIARFDQPVCPGVIGGSAGLAVALVDGIRANIRAVGAPLAPEKCRPNAYVVLTGQADAVFADFVRHHKWFLRDSIGGTRLAALSKGNVPVRSFHLTLTGGGNGDTLAADEMGGPATAGRGGGIASRLIMNVRQSSYAAIAIVDSHQALGKSVRQLADVATVHLLLDVQPGAGRRAPDSILSLFDGDSPPQGLTTFDRGMLTGLYRRADPSAPYQIQRASMARAVEVERARVAAR